VELHKRDLEPLSKLAKAGEFRDRTTGNHMTRKAHDSALVSVNIGLTPTPYVLEFAAPILDIGKIEIPDPVLLKDVCSMPRKTWATTSSKAARPSISARTPSSCLVTTRGTTDQGYRNSL
jgi:response regulator RpfG family c-di-GMP phosphodiesterase